MTKKLFKSIITSKIPIAWIAGVRLNKWDENEVSTHIKYNFLNQNPFNSIFWAVQGMAAEFSSGLMVMDKLEKKKANVSMLIVDMHAKYYKKAIGKVVFTCKDGILIDNAIENAVKTNNSVELIVKSFGTDQDGDVVSEFTFTWSLKTRIK